MRASIACQHPDIPLAFEVHYDRAPHVRCGPNPASGERCMRVHSNSSRDAPRGSERGNRAWRVSLKLTDTPLVGNANCGAHEVVPVGKRGTGRCDAEAECAAPWRAVWRIVPVDEANSVQREATSPRGQDVDFDELVFRTSSRRHAKDDAS